MSHNLQEHVEAQVERLEAARGVEDLGILDVEMVVGVDDDIRNVYLITATGGPQIEVDLANGMVRGYWSSDYIDAPFDNEDLVDELWRYYSEVYHG